jgi:hypothetical protein
MEKIKNGFSLCLCASVVDSLMRTDIILATANESNPN